MSANRALFGTHLPHGYPKGIYSRPSSSVHEHALALVAQGRSRAFEVSLLLAPLSPSTGNRGADHASTILRGPPVRPNISPI